MLIYVFNVLLIKKICTKENHQNQRHYTFSRITTKKERKEIIKKTTALSCSNKAFHNIAGILFSFFEAISEQNFHKKLLVFKKKCFDYDNDLLGIEQA